MNNEEVFFSIVMPVYNRAAFLTTSISSVLNQQYKNFELLCVNDGSTDDSKDVIEKFANQDGRVTIINQSNLGRCIARNTGIENAKGNWICFLDSDDVYFNNHLSVLHQLIQQFPQQYIFATEQVHNGKVRKYANAKFYQPICEMELADCVYTNPIQLNQLCFNKSKTAVRFINENVPISEDWLFLREIINGRKIIKTHIITNELKEHENRSMNATKAEEIARWNNYTAGIFLKRNITSEEIKERLWIHTELLCANIILSSSGDRTKAMSYVKNVINKPKTYTDRLFYKAIVKFFISFMRKNS